MTAPQAVVKIGAKPKTNKKLFIILGVVIVLVLAMKVVVPSLSGGASAVKAFHPSSIFHAQKPVAAATTNGNGTIVGRPARDPFAPPPGAVLSH